MRMTDVLQREGQWDLMIGDEEIVKRPDSTILVLPREYQTALDQYQAQRRRIQKAVGTLRLGMTDAIAVFYYNEVWIPPGKIWKDVQSNYETVGGYDANHLQRELYEWNLDKCGTVLEYINKIRELRDKLVISGNKPTYAQMIFHLFEGLPKTPEWKTWIMVTKSVLSSQTTMIGYTELQAKLTADEVELQLERDIEPGQALYSKSTKTGQFQKPSNYSRKGVAPGARSKPIKGKFSGSCHHCGKPGHKICECRAKANEDTWLGISVKRSMNQTGRAGIMEEQLWLTTDANAESVHEEKPVEKAMMGKHVVPEMDWVIDFGFTNHMMKHAGVSLEGTYKRLTSDKRQMRTATGELVSAAGISTVRIRIWLPSQASQTILLQQVLHIPSASSTNLISVSPLTVEGINISFKSDIAEVFRDSILMAIAKKVDRLYTILTDVSVTDQGLLISLKDQTLTTLWQYRLADLHHQALLKMSSNELVSGWPSLQANSITG